MYIKINLNEQKIDNGTPPEFAPLHRFHHSINIFFLKKKEEEEMAWSPTGVQLCMLLLCNKPTMSPCKVHSETIPLHGSTENKSNPSQSGTHIFIPIFLGDKPQAALIKPQFAILECTTCRPTKEAPAIKNHKHQFTLLHQLVKTNSRIHGQVLKSV